MPLSTKIKKAALDEPKSASRPKKIARVKSRRDKYWPDAEEVIWKKTAGWLIMPRLIPLIMHLIKERNGNQDASKAYLELWSRTDDSRFVEIQNPSRHAYAAGYTSTRAVRTWQDQLCNLEKDGFIRIHRSPVGDISFVLVVDPLKVCRELRNKGEISDQWWEEFERRAAEIGQDLPGEA